jgi:hypothetical protein
VFTVTRPPVCARGVCASGVRAGGVSADGVCAGGSSVAWRLAVRKTFRVFTEPTRLHC